MPLLLFASAELQQTAIGKTGGAHGPATLVIGRRQPNPMLKADQF